MTTTIRPTSLGALDPRAFGAMADHLPTTVGVAGSRRDGSPIGMKVGTSTSVSLNALLVGFLGDRGSATLPLMVELEHLTFSVLEDGAPIANQFRWPLSERCDSLPWSVSSRATPLIDSAVMSLHTSFHSALPVGDRHHVLGEVVDVKHHHPARGPLAFAHGRTMRLDPLHASAASDAAGRR